MRWEIFTLFPGMFAGPLSESIIKRAADRGLVEIALHDWREQATDRHRTVDDTPYGGGAGMVLQAPPLVRAVEAALGDERDAVPTILLSPAGRPFTQRVAEELSQRSRVALICGHYEGFDERVRDLIVTDELSLGDYVLTGGELAAMVIVDATTRLLPGVIEAASLAEESHTSGLLEGPHYTRPLDFRGLGVPPVLVGGHHARIAAWRRREALRRTLRSRPDLLETAPLTPTDRRDLAELMDEEAAAQGEASPARDETVRTTALPTP
ncbi:MAG: tRNA (guanine(37)-N(1))-methyltransferase [uncultured Thermomicrobiales bacterium]|uniref:tRNA (guanine-N(1)-)-methyltransferase n=1 Tax=uncultured Thermomicrobiales bacterium TaxID=1645740 RepID=A0A6J4VZE2_9BACT|nr:MAG: tRNA (guanine(37)-N(1))-methyltransferase [uncultured Thermomicrobiales bacterium]